MREKSQKEDHALKVRWPLSFICSYAPLVTQHYRHVASEKPVGSHFVLSLIDTLCYQQKEMEQRRTKVAPLCLLFGCYSWQKGTSQDKATSSSEEIKSITVSIVELCLVEGISHLVRRKFS